MPLYEYQCDACGRRFERIQKFSDPPVSICPTCGGAVRKLLSSPAIQFKGSGFYITDLGGSSVGGFGPGVDVLRNFSDGRVGRLPPRGAFLVIGHSGWNGTS